MPDSATVLREILDDLSPEQRIAVECNARLVVVPACPGSGKTRTFVAAIARELLAPRGAIAALSFTNVAEQEVRKRLQSRTASLGYPNFLGTIDTFLLRYVVRVFGGNWVNLRKFSHPVGDDDFSVQSESISYGTSHPRLIEFSLVRQNGATLLYLGKTLIEDEATRLRAFRLKQAAWKRGHVAYDDVCYLAARLLESADVRGILLQRFPVFLVDEFQDTGGSREDALLRLLGDERLTKGFVVGDPDQCIMQFNLARPDLFDDVRRLAGSETCPLTSTRRFHRHISSVASHLSGRGEALVSIPEPPDGAGPFTVLLVHDYAVRQQEFSAVVNAFGRFLAGQNFEDEHNRPAILTWSGKVANLIRGDALMGHPNFGCKWLELLFAGLCHLREGEAAKGYKKAERVVSSACGFAGAAPTTYELKAFALSGRDWKRAVWGILLKLQPQHEAETVMEWIDRVKVEMRSVCARLGVNEAIVRGKVKANRTKIGAACEASVSDHIAGGAAGREGPIVVNKVHQVKGMEFPAVCYFVPKPSAREPGVREAWFGNWASEHARVSYVAISRAQRGLMLAIPREWGNELSSFPEGVSFIESFQLVADLDNY